MPRNKTLTKEQVIQAINRWFIQHGQPPTVEELKNVLGVGSKRTVTRYLQWLKEEGDIERWEGARGLRLLKQPGAGSQTKPIPLVGQVPAGPLMVAEENLEGYVRLPIDLLKPESGKFFLLHVRGDSMNQARVKGEKIENGDIVLVRQQPSAETGDIVVALIDGEATIKRFTQGQGYYVLKPESSNPKHQPIVLTDDFSIQGIVVGLIKKGSEFLNFIEG